MYRENARQRFLSDNERDRLGRVLADLEEREEETVFVTGAIRMPLLTGARLGEVLPPEWRDVDLQRGHMGLAGSKTGQKSILFNETAVQLLARRPRIDGNPHAFIGFKPDGHFIDLQEPCRRVLARADIEDVGTQDLGHAFASIAAAQVASLKLIGQLLGHSTMQTTQRNARLVADQVRAANEDVGKRPGGLLSGG